MKGEDKVVVWLVEAVELKGLGWVLALAHLSKSSTCSRTFTGKYCYTDCISTVVMWGAGLLQWKLSLLSGTLYIE